MDTNRTIVKRRFSLGSSGFSSPPPASRRKLILSLEVSLENDEIEISVLSDEVASQPDASQTIQTVAQPMPPPQMPSQPPQTLPPQPPQMPPPQPPKMPAPKAVVAQTGDTNNNDKDKDNVQVPKHHICIYCTMKRACKTHPAGDGPVWVFNRPQQQVQPPADVPADDVVADVPDPAPPQMAVTNEADFAAGLQKTQDGKRRTSSSTEEASQSDDESLDWTCSSHDDDPLDWTVRTEDLTYNGDTRIFEV